MRTVTFLLLSVLIGLAVAEEPEAPLAEECDKELCELPKCRCSSTDIPGDLAARDTPQVKNTSHYHSTPDQRPS